MTQGPLQRYFGIADLEVKNAGGGAMAALSDHLFAVPSRSTPAIQQVHLCLYHVFCAAVDRNGYLPVHNAVFSKPQGSDPTWNNANCRNRRLFNDRTGLAVRAEPVRVGGMLKQARP